MAFEIFLLVTALSIDIFVSCAAYGTNGIFFNAKQIAVLNGICSLCLGTALLFGTLIDGHVPEKFTREICFFSLSFLGCIKLADASIRHYLRRHKKIDKKIGFVFSQLHFLLTVYSDPLEADTDRNNCLSWKEIIFFSLAMSIDCFVTGTMAAFLKLPVLFTVGALFLVGELCAYAGFWLGKKATRCPLDLSWLGGVLFLLLAAAKR